MITQNGKISGEIRSVWAGSSNQSRGIRVLPRNASYFVHVTSRMVQQRFLFDADAKRAFIRFVYDWAEFSGIHVLTHCVMDNHFHLFLWVPTPKALSWEELTNRVSGVWSTKKVDSWVRRFQAASTRDQAAMKKALTDRMCNLPAYVRVVKQSFSAWFNRTHGFRGALWESRYRSLVVSDVPESLLRVATYIDLNPIRARMCKDPAEYAFSGFGGATRHNAKMAAGIAMLLEKAKAEEKIEALGPSLQTYRLFLYAHGRSAAEEVNASPKRRKRHGFTSMEVLQEFAAAVAVHHATDAV